jgi:hypothetical protein
LIFIKIRILNFYFKVFFNLFRYLQFFGIFNYGFKKKFIFRGKERARDGMPADPGPTGSGRGRLRRTTRRPTRTRRRRPVGEKFLIYY